MRRYFKRKTAGLILSIVMTVTVVIPGMTIYADEYAVDSGELLIADENRAGLEGSDTGDVYTDEPEEQADSVSGETASGLNSDDEIVIDESNGDDFTDESENIVDDEPVVEDGILPDGLIEEMESAAEDSSEYFTGEFEMDVADPFSPETADDMEEEGLLLLASSAGTASSLSFGTSYGQQLTGMAAEFYDSMVDHYINCRESGDWRISCPTGNDWYSVHLNDLSSYDTSSEWIEIKNAMKYDVQSALNAFGYDYPEFFWERIYSTSWGLNAEKDSAGKGGTIRAEYLSLKTKETYTGSRGDIDTFFTAVDNVVAGLSSTCDYIGDGVISDAEYAKGAHDFSATALWYDSSMLSTYNNNTDHAEAYRIFTPAPAFIDSIGGGGACEAYSRTIKVLLDRLGVTCCLLSGNSHMWNGIMIDGTWYLTDATWDDDGNETPGTTYLLSGSDSKHQTSGCITGTGNELVFSVPAVSLSRYHEYGEWTVLEEPTCLTNGLREHICFLCGQAERETLTDGQHVFTDWTVEKQPSCTQTGTQTRNCTVCGRTETESIPALHNWSTWKATATATVFSAEKQERTCSVCGTKEARTAGSKLVPKISINASSIKLKKGQKTTKVTVSGLAKGDSVKSWTSSNTKVVTCGNGWIKAGKKTGTVYVTVTTKAGASARIKVKVQKAKVAVSKISVTSKKITLDRGKTFCLSTVLSPLTTEYSVKYTSSNKKTATVSRRGVIKAKKKGKCTITVKAGKKTVKVKVTVQ